MSGGVPMMTSIIKLNDEEIAAVVAYMQYLSRQP
jgi:cytochrome c1